MIPDNRAYFDGDTWHKVAGRDVCIRRDGPHLRYWCYFKEQLVTTGINDRAEEDVLRFLEETYKRQAGPRD